MGNWVPLIGLLFFLLTGFGAMAIDLGYTNYQQLRTQTAADNAAIAGAQALIATRAVPIKLPPTQRLKTTLRPTASGRATQVNVTVDNPPKRPTDHIRA